MLIIRPTASLFKRMKLKPTVGKKISTTVLGDWYVNDIVLSRRQFLLCVSSTTRLCVVMEAAPYQHFPERLSDSVQKVLQSIGVNPTLISKEIDKMENYDLYKTSDRSIIGSMTEAAKMLKNYQNLGLLKSSDPLSISKMLNKVISLKLSEGCPEDQALKAFGINAKELSIVPNESNTKKSHLYIVK